MAVQDSSDAPPIIRGNTFEIAGMIPASPPPVMEYVALLNVKFRRSSAVGKDVSSWTWSSKKISE